MEQDHQLNNLNDITGNERDEALWKHNIIQPFLQMSRPVLKSPTK